MKVHRFSDFNRPEGKTYCYTCDREVEKTGLHKDFIQQRIKLTD